MCLFLPSMNLKRDLGLTGNLVMMEIPDWSKYGATKSTTSARSDVIVIPAMAMLISPLTKSPEDIEEFNQIKILNWRKGLLSRGVCAFLYSQKLPDFQNFR